MDAYHALKAARGRGQRLPDAAYKALAMKAEAEVEKDRGARDAMKALTQAAGSAIKASKPEPCTGEGREATHSTRYEITHAIRR